MPDITLIQSATAAGSGTSLTASLDSPATAGKTIIVIAAAHGVTMTSTLGPDTQGNEYNRDHWTAIGAGDGAADYKLVEIWSTRVVTGGDISVTYTVSTPATGLSLFIQEWDGLFTGAVSGGGPGAAWIDHGFGISAGGSYPPLTLTFATDYPDLTAYYGTTLPVLGIVGSFNNTLQATHTFYPSATGSVTIGLPTFVIGQLSCAVVVLYVGITDVAPPPPPIESQKLWADLWVWRRLEKFTSVDENLNFPPGAMRALLYSLACELYENYPAAAKKYKFEELLADTEEALKEYEALNAANAVAEEPKI